MMTVRGGTDGKHTEQELWSPYVIGSNPQLGGNIIYEPLAFYSAFADKTIMWLAEDYKYSPDYKELTVKTRPGITWSDGKPFSAEDVAYSLNTLNELGGKVKWGKDVQEVLESAAVVDPNTTLLKFKVSAPRFFTVSRPTLRRRSSARRPFTENGRTSVTSYLRANGVAAGESVVM